jgi:hypothetical protein
LIFFAKKRLFRIKIAITFVYGLEKSVIYEKLSTENFTSDFNGLRPFAQFFVSQNSKGKYESTKILDFVKKIENLIFFKKNYEFLLLFLLLFSCFEVFILF